MPRKFGETSDEFGKYQYSDNGFYTSNLNRHLFMPSKECSKHFHSSNFILSLWAWVFTYFKSKIRQFLPEEFMETESAFIISGGFSASVIEPHFSNLEMDSSTESLFLKADWLLRNKASLCPLKKGTLQTFSIISKISELAESASCQNIKFFLSLPFTET